MQWRLGHSVFAKQRRALASLVMLALFSPVALAQGDSCGRSTRVSVPAETHEHQDDAHSGANSAALAAHDASTADHDGGAPEAPCPQCDGNGMVSLCVVHCLTVAVDRTRDLTSTQRVRVAPLAEAHRAPASIISTTEPPPPRS